MSESDVVQLEQYAAWVEAAEADAPLAVALSDVAEVRAYFREEIFVVQRRDGSAVSLSRYDYYRLSAALGAAATLRPCREVTGWYDAVWQVLGTRPGVPGEEVGPS